jgi:ubiquinone/menaquinone biosynthesis C-methylase UbiE
MPDRTYLIVIATLTFGGAAVIAWKFAFFILPLSWTGEHARLADVLRLKEGSVVADVGAGTGALAGAIARSVGEGGVVYATELSRARRTQIAELARGSGDPIRVIEATEETTGLDAECCDAIYMRAVVHHITQREEFARSIARAARPGARIAVIDFPPGALWFHGRDHGVTAAQTREAFEGAGLRLIHRIDDWGGGMFLLLFEKS